MLITALSATGLFWLGYTGILAVAWTTDHFFVVSFMWACYALASLYLGTIAYRIERLPPNAHTIVDNNRFEFLLRRLTIPWFVTSQLYNLGLIGTVIGFIAMLLSAFLGKSFSDPSVLSEVMQLVGTNWATALFATATGLIGAFILGTQTFLANMALEIHQYEA
jgi:hypothetical protein